MNYHNIVTVSGVLWTYPNVPSQLSPGLLPRSLLCLP